MSERTRGQQLCDVIDAPFYRRDGHEVARAICEHLGLTWDDVDHLETIVRHRQVLRLSLRHAGRVREHAERFAALLEAARIEPPHTEPTP